MEHIREVKIIVEIDTNKDTYREETASLNGAVKFFGETMNDIGGGSQRLRIVDDEDEDANRAELREAIDCIPLLSTIPLCDSVAVKTLVEAARKFVP